MNNTISIVEKSNERIAVLDLYSKLLQNNTIMINEEITIDSVSKYQAELLWLASKIQPSQPIIMYINSPGGSVRSGLGLYDIMQFIKKQGYIIRTINVGSAASMAAILLMAGTKGYRESLPHCRVLIHELSTMAEGKCSLIEDDYKESKILQNTLNEIITENSDSNLIKECERKDLWLSAEEALSYNIIDKII